MVSVVNIEGVTKKFNNNTVVDNLNLEIQSGSIFGLLGPNGAGKTTIMRMILGLVRADGGSIKVFGKDMSLNREEILREVGCMIESASFYGNLSAFENLKIVCMMKDINIDKIETTLKLVGLDKCGDKKVSKFSLGMKQRLGIAMAIIGEPKLIILDEPVNGLDPAGIHEIRTLIKSLAEDLNITIFISSHILSEIELIADEVGIIKDGKIIYKGKLQKLLESQESSIEVSVSDKKKTIEYFESQNIEVKDKGSKLVISGDYSVEYISKVLMGQEIKIFSISNQNNSLEDIYLKMVGK